jgi:hypothetical protein
MTTIAAFTPTNPVATNPFATRFTSPGRLPPLDSSGVAIDLDELLSRFRHLGDRAAIRGPHGTGKSTLLAAMAECIRRDGRLGGLVRLGLGWRRDLGAVAAGLAACGRDSVLCIDSWERLGGVAAAITCVVARATGRGLLVTSHGEGPLPTLVSCSTTPRLLCTIVDRLPDRHGLLSSADIEETFREAGGNLREALFLLYDRFEQARSHLLRS